MAMPTRSEMIERLSAKGLEDYARAYGFPSPAALEAVIRCGIKLHAGQLLTAEDSKAIGRCYPAVPFEQLERYRHHINQAPTSEIRFKVMCDSVGIADASRAASICAAYGGQQDSDALAARMAARDGADRMRPAPSDAERAAQRARWASADPRAGLRADIERAARLSEAPSLPPTAYDRRQALADRIEANMRYQTAN